MLAVSNFELILFCGGMCRHKTYTRIKFEMAQQRRSEAMNKLFTEVKLVTLARIEGVNGAGPIKEL
jgi:sulfatase maturation enzyme AslB (radical SAM superfamily)